MGLIIRVPGADWSGRGFPNVNPFIAAGLVYGFDFRERSSMLTDVTGNYVITPKRVDPKLGIANVTDPTILVPVDSGAGLRVELGYLQSSEIVAAFSSGGATQFTLLVVGRSSGVALPADKVQGVPSAGTLYDWGSIVTPNGISMNFGGGGVVTSGKVSARIEDAGSNLNPEAATANRDTTVANVMFLTYDGTTFTLLNKTRGVSAAGTHASLAVNSPITVNAGAEGKTNLGGNAHPTSTIHAWYPVIYQSAKWNRVLTAGEIDDQYARCKDFRQGIVL